MKSTELRAGNVVSCLTRHEKYNIVEEICYSDSTRGSYVKLKGAYHGVWLEHKNKELIKGVELTEAWFNSLGFKKEFLSDQSGHYYTLKLRDKLYCDLSISSGDNNGFVEATLFPYEEWFRYKYVHELQNLYFGLTGKELTIKDFKP